MKLRALIIQVFNEITEDICHQVISNITVRVEEVARCNGCHIEHLISEDKSSSSGLSICVLVSSIVLK
jgi:hypothetical protein